MSKTARTGLLGARHILVVEDHDDSRAMLRAVLESEGALVTEAEDADRAVAMAGSALCDLVITDIRMRGNRHDGVWLLDHFRESPRFAELPVIAVTGCKERREDLKGRGFALVLIKPVDVADLPGLLASCLEGR